MLSEMLSEVFWGFGAGLGAVLSMVVLAMGSDWYENAKASWRQARRGR